MNESYSLTAENRVLKSMACPNCGSRKGIEDAYTKELDKIVVTCKACGTPFISEIGERLFAVEKEKTDKLENCWGQLKDAIAINHFKKITKFSEEILDINDEDYRAKYYKAYGNFKGEDVSGYLMSFYKEKISPDVRSAELEEIIDHIIAHIETDHYDEVDGFIRRCGRFVNDISSKLNDYSKAYHEEIRKEEEYECVEKDIFLCYNENESAEIINKIVSSLENSKRSVWLYSVNLDPNQSKNDKNDRINKAIDRCKVFLYVLSEKSSKLKDMRREVQRAVELGKTRFEIRIDSVELPKNSAIKKAFDEKDCFDATKNLNTSLNELKAKLKNVFDKETDKDSTSTVENEGEKTNNPGNDSPPPPKPNNNDYEVKDGVLKRVNPKIAVAEIPKGVKKIDDEVLKSHDIIKVVIPASVEELGVGVFKDCKKLREVKIHEESKLKSIPADAFRNCESLYSIALPKGITAIGDCAFSKCENLKEITIDKDSALTSIGEKAFSHCTKLKAIKLPHSVTELGKYAFENCNLEGELVIPENVERIPEGMCFSCTKLHSVGLPANAKAIGARAFECCSDLEIIVIPDKIVKIEKRAFKACDHLRSVNISQHNMLKKIAADAFEGCPIVEFPEKVRKLISRAKVIARFKKWLHRSGPSVLLSLLPIVLAVIAFLTPVNSSVLPYVSVILNANLIPTAVLLVFGVISLVISIREGKAIYALLGDLMVILGMVGLLFGGAIVAAAVLQMLLWIFAVIIPLCYVIMRRSYI